MAGKGDKAKRGPGTIGKAYLIGYNAALVVGWSYVLCLLTRFYFTDDFKGQSLWDVEYNSLMIFQNAAVLEILHAAIGLVRSNVVITTFQVLSRVMVVCGVLLATPASAAAASAGLPIALFAWSVTEIIRYGYYFANLIGFVPHLLVWLRYTTFIALYPIGVTGELLCFYAAQSYAGSHPDLWSYALPNTWNFTFSYHYLLIFVMLLYIPLFPQMYLHMFAQRKKILGSPSPQKTKKVH
ncbi:very-long-chain (3R)-3-hydroxyacyl-CoA dehydratase 2 [Diachasma alloeum]|uniref:very-long-chain (3R)-3-hydroxyacyl-CoA dehydratase 2 n=1 Tax=Diachasma alloeum TaxID=454923 RepID=UPI0007383A16|nr:very-long-chain (3R)-3-hydroxyacyl-CoA dehydratase 2 [Diachasma alloeum]XP_015114274.1 very-long-chain (3R)-3-hydroxyacyl-CoA dehydratase 2 [Diachasma alloeum]